MSESEKTDWLTESLRLTAFVTVDADLRDWSGSWKALMGDEPDAAEVRAKEHVVQESGQFHEATLTYRHVPLRIDWTVHPSDMTSEPWATVGRFADDTQPFVELMKKWLAIAPEIKRLAFGAVLLIPVSNRDEGYTTLSRYLPFPLDLEARNFTYQINRRRDSRLGLPGLEINRLSKWSCLERRMTQLQFVIGESAIASEDSPSNFAMRLEVDINTVPEYPKSLESGNLTGLFSEFIELGAEIAEKGDIP